MASVFTLASISSLTLLAATSILALAALSSLAALSWPGPYAPRRRTPSHLGSCRTKTASSCLGTPRRTGRAPPLYSAAPTWPYISPPHPSGWRCSFTDHLSPVDFPHNLRVELETLIIFVTHRDLVIDLLTPVDYFLLVHHLDLCMKISDHIHQHVENNLAGVCDLFLSNFLVFHHLPPPLLHNLQCQQPLLVDPHHDSSERLINIHKS